MLTVPKVAVAEGTPRHLWHVLFFLCKQIMPVIRRNTGQIFDNVMVEGWLSLIYRGVLGCWPGRGKVTSISYPVYRSSCLLFLADSYLDWPAHALAVSPTQNGLITAIRMYVVSHQQWRISSIKEILLWGLNKKFKNKNLQNDFKRQWGSRMSQK